MMTFAERKPGRTKIRYDNTNVIDLAGSMDVDGSALQCRSLSYEIIHHSGNILVIKSCENRTNLINHKNVSMRSSSVRIVLLKSYAVPSSGSTPRRRSRL